jgi:PIN domain nuclease of toxin-antitoxin system
VNRILLDTHIALWALQKPDKLTVAEQNIISAQENDVFVSTASLWEIAIKHALGAGRNSSMPFSAKEARFYFEKAGFMLLPINPDHIIMLEGLPPLHADPFDRLILAQAKAEQLHLITHDKQILAYFS